MLNLGSEAISSTERSATYSSIVLKKRGVVEGKLTIDEAADALWLTIETKRTRADPKVLLILDAANVGQFAFQPVIERFREWRGIDAARVGFKEIWIAAPTAERTVRLDTPS